ncbi:unnamed protein product, partial [marine sediment metagenome]
LLLDYVNAMLDAGRAAEAVAFFEPLIRDYGYNLGLRALMVEALRMLKRDDEASLQVAFMARVYEPLAEAAAKRTAQQVAELGWFALTYSSQPQAALEWAKAAALSAGDDPFVQRVMGAAELATGSVEAGARRLAALAERDVFAAAILARHYYAREKPRAGRRAVLRAAANVRTGPAWRQLAAIASQHKVLLPPVAHAETMIRAAKAIPQHFFVLGRSPERFVTVKLSASRKQFAPGEPLAVSVER